MQNDGLGIDYLNSIAPKAPKKSLFSMRNIVLLAAGAVVIFVGLMIASSVMTASREKSRDSIASLYLRIGNMQTITVQYGGELDSSGLRAINSGLDTQLSSILYDFGVLLPSQKIVVAEIDEEVRGREMAHLDSVREELRVAKLNAVFDRTYPRVISYELTLIMTQMDKIYKESNDDVLKSFLSRSYLTLSELRELFDEFRAE